MRVDGPIRKSPTRLDYPALRSRSARPSKRARLARRLPPGPPVAAPPRSVRLPAPPPPRVLPRRSGDAAAGDVMAPAGLEQSQAPGSPARRAARPIRGLGIRGSGGFEQRISSCLEPRLSDSRCSIKEDADGQTETDDSSSMHAPLYPCIQTSGRADTRARSSPSRGGPRRACPAARPPDRHNPRGGGGATADSSETSVWEKRIRSLESQVDCLNRKMTYFGDVDVHFETLDFDIGETSCSMPPEFVGIWRTTDHGCLHAAKYAWNLPTHRWAEEGRRATTVGCRRMQRGRKGFAGTWRDPEPGRPAIWGACGVPAYAAKSQLMLMQC